MYVYWVDWYNVYLPVKKAIGWVRKLSKYGLVPGELVQCIPSHLAVGGAHGWMWKPKKHRWGLVQSIPSCPSPVQGASGWVREINKHGCVH